ncbi:hypothetical protein MMC16_000148 [Acarospora aff. strigata]|nr:hypothetical protein [Acarospora aff. strigata]
MQYSKIAIIAAVATPFVAAQDLASLPACAQAAATSSLGSTGCALTDIKCICNASSYLSSLQQQISSACNAADQASALAFAQQICSSAGVNLNVPSAAVSSASSVVSSSAAAASSMMSSAAQDSTMMTTAVAPSSAAVVSAISDGQPQAPTSLIPVSQISDGQPQAPTETAVSQISDGQIQAPTATATAVSQISDGQPQVPTDAPVAPVANTTVAANVTTPTSATPSAFTGAASSFGVQWVAAGAVGAAAVFFAGL